MTYKMRTLITWKCLLSSVFSLMHYKIRFLLKHLLQWLHVNCFSVCIPSCIIWLGSSLGGTLDTMITWQWFHFGIYFYINCFLLDNSFIRSPPWILLGYMYFSQSSKKIESIFFCLAIVSSKLVMGPFGLWYASLSEFINDLKHGGLLFTSSASALISTCSISEVTNYYLIGELYWLWNDAGLLIKIDYYFPIFSLTAQITRK